MKDLLHKVRATVRPADRAPDADAHWDYIIVGGGSAGCVLANRLSADPDCTVLLLEAGGWDTDLRLRIPAGMSMLPEKFNWMYPGAPDPSRNGKEDEWASGRVLGGGSSINMMLWVRGEASDFDGWRDQGCDGWGFEDVLPFFERMETYLDGPSPSRGSSGPIGVADFSVDLEGVWDFLTAAEQAGHRRNPDYNGVTQQGCGLAQLSQRRGLRSSSARAYLAPARKRPNLTVLTGAFVTRIVLDDGAATGVEYHYEDGSHTATLGATGEVVLSAGSLISPKLLMLSGIGPADHLASHGIEPVVDAPGVGANLQEHAYGWMSIETKSDTLVEEMTPVRMAKQGLQYLRRGRGALTASGGAAVVFCQLDGSHPTDCEIILMPVGMVFNDEEGGESTEHSVHDVKLQPHSMMLFPSFVHPHGRGTVRLASSDPTEPPLIEHELVGERDMEQLIAACRKAREIIGAPAMVEAGAVETAPGSDVQTDAEWADYLRATAFKPFHPVGTCRMGDDAGSVVDPQCRVRGVRNLRVIDASIFPTITSGNTNAPSIMVAERASEFLLTDGGG